MDVRKVKIGTKLLEVKLTDEQRIELGVELDAHYEERKILDAELADLKSAEKSKKGEIEEKQAEIDALIGPVGKGVQPREVEVENHLHFGRNVVKVVRLDTSETIEERPMTADERMRWPS